MAETLQARIAHALGGVRNARLDTDVYSADMVRDIATTLDGRVRLTLLLAPEDDATLVRDVRQTVERVDGVSDVRVDVKDASARAAAPAASRAAPP
ncbi:MAG: Scaffold protein for [4Fe-4S] cluster assembly, MRP-like, similar to chloroplast-targeted plant protein HCF101, partial [uncultured Gemmatimonadaceae bacterium]